VLGAAVGAGVSELTGASTGKRGMLSTNGVVAGLFGASLTNPALFKGRALNPCFGMSMPALVKSPIFIRSRRFKPAAISSRRLFAAVCRSFSRFLFLFEIFAIKIILLRLELILQPSWKVLIVVLQLRWKARMYHTSPLR
jgi:hypothetical protein